MLTAGAAGAKWNRRLPRANREMPPSTYMTFGGLKTRNDPEITKDKTDW